MPHWPVHTLIKKHSSSFFIDYWPAKTDQIEKSLGFCLKCVQESCVKIPVDVAVRFFAPDEGGFDHRHRLGPMGEGQGGKRACGLPSCNRGFAHRYAGVARSYGGSAPEDRWFTPGDGVLSPQDRKPAFGEGGLAWQEWGFPLIVRVFFGLLGCFGCLSPGFKGPFHLGVLALGHQGFAEGGGCGSPAEACPSQSHSRLLPLDGGVSHGGGGHSPEDGGVAHGYSSLSPGYRGASHCQGSLALGDASVAHRSRGSQPEPVPGCRLLTCKLHNCLWCSRVKSQTKAAAAAALNRSDHHV